MNITYLRESGVLKRIHGTPLPTSAYLVGIAGNAITNTASQVALITVAGARGLRRSTGRRTGRRSPCSSTLGVVLLRVAGRRALARDPELRLRARLRQCRVLPVIFISGVFYDADNAPGFLRGIAEALPLKHLIDGLSGAIVTGEGVGQHGPALAVLALWSAVGIVLAVRGFSWERRRS